MFLFFHISHLLTPNITLELPPVTQYKKPVRVSRKDPSVPAVPAAAQTKLAGDQKPTLSEEWHH